MRGWSVRVIVVAHALAVLTACSGDGPASDEGGTPVDAPAETTAAAEYMEGLCAAIASYQSDLDAENATFQERLSGGTPTPEETKEALGGFLRTLADRTGQLVDEVKALGTPDVDNGGDVHAALMTAFQQVVDLFDQAQADIDALSTEDPAALVEGLAAAGTKLQEAATGITAPFDDISSPDLEAAAADAPSCKGVI